MNDEIKAPPKPLPVGAVSRIEKVMVLLLLAVLVGVLVAHFLEVRRVYLIALLVGGTSTVFGGGIIATHLLYRRSEHQTVL